MGWFITNFTMWLAKGRHNNEMRQCFEQTIESNLKSTYSALIERDSYTNVKIHQILCWPNIHHKYRFGCTFTYIPCIYFYFDSPTIIFSDVCIQRQSLNVLFLSTGRCWRFSEQKVFESSQFIPFYPSIRSFQNLTSNFGLTLIKKKTQIFINCY